MKIISACLCGIDCKYNGENNRHPLFVQLYKKGEVLPVCPEQLGELPTPRPASEIQNGSGEEVLLGSKKVMTKDGQDVTTSFIAGAKRTLELIKPYPVDLVIFKSRSPSCGVGKVYDGSFSGNLRPGDGVATAFLKENGYKVVSDEEYLKEVGTGESH